ncbi:hypothetical protein [Paenibacillus sp. RC67]|nr:hypothetical protein [Paenibacillus sp. RC67]
MIGRRLVAEINGWLQSGKVSPPVRLEGGSMRVEEERLGIR